MSDSILVQIPNGVRAIILQYLHLNRHETREKAEKAFEFYKALEGSWVRETFMEKVKEWDDAKDRETKDFDLEENQIKGVRGLIDEIFKSKGAVGGAQFALLQFDDYLRGIQDELKKKGEKK